MRLAGKHAFITGAGSGIGQAIAERFAREGALVVAAGRTRESVKDTVQRIGDSGGKALPVGADVSDADAVQSMMDETLGQIGHIDILVNNAGKALGDGVDVMDVSTWDADIAVVLRSVFLCSKAILPRMIERKCGVIVNIASVNGLSGLGEEGYSAAKAGMINLTLNMATRYGPEGIRANSISPGTIRTPIWDDVLERDPEVLERLSHWYPLGRIGEVEDVANAALFLVSDEAGWITGVNLTVDGGLMAGNYRMSRELMGGE